MKSTSVWIVFSFTLCCIALLDGQPAFSDPEPALSKNTLQAVLTGSRKIIAEKTLNRIYDPVEVYGELFPQMLDWEFDRLGLLACRQGKLEIIPYQFDEWTAKGEMILKLGEDNNAHKADNHFDPQDQLVFMARDLGDRMAAESWQANGLNGVEIEVIDPLNHNRAWAYLIYFDEKIPPAELKNTLKFGPDTTDFKIYGDSFTLFGTSRTIGGKLYRTAINRHIAVPPEAGGNGKNLIDRGKVRLSCNLLFGLIKIKLDEDKFIGGIVRYKGGAVRAMGRQWIKLLLPYKLKTPRIFGDVYVYDTMIFIPGQVKFPINPGYVLTDFKMSTGYDLHEPNGRGMKYYSNTNPQGFLMDGKMDEDELTQYDDSRDDWRCIVGPQGWIVHRSKWDESYMNQADIRMKYIDDVNHHSPPDYFSGDLGFYYTESTIKSLKAGTYNFQLEWYWPYNLYTPNGPDMEAITAVCNFRDHPLLVKAGERQAVNSAASVKPTAP